MKETKKKETFQQSLMAQLRNQRGISLILQKGNLCKGFLLNRTEKRSHQKSKLKQHFQSSGSGYV